MLLPLTGPVAGAGIEIRRAGHGWRGEVPGNGATVTSMLSMLRLG